MRSERRERIRIAMAVIISMVVVPACFSASASAEGVGDGLLPHRSWQFHDHNWDWLKEQIPKARAEGMNRIQLSHDIVMDAEQLWEGGGHEGRLELVRKAIRLAHENDLKVDMWTHELSGLPKDRFRNPDNNHVVLSDELWQWVDAKYEKLFSLVPELDGLVLTFAETDHAVYKSGIDSDDPPPARVGRLIKAIGDVCKRKGKLLIVRTFVYEPEEIGWLHTALTEIGRQSPGDHIMVMTKCVPHDWTPYYPFNPLLGNVAGLPQVFEIDLGQEFTGQNRILHCEVDYVKVVMDYAREKGVIGGVARVERHDNHAIGTPNEVNIHAFSRLLHDGTLSPDTLWKEWVEPRYGKRAAPHVIRALKRTYDITNLTYFPLEYWIVNHSRVPNWGYAYGHITSRENCKWIPSPKQVMARNELLRPNADTLIRIQHEKDLAARLSEASLLDLEHARDDLSDEDYRELRGYLRLGQANVEAFRRHNMAMFSLLHYQARKEAGDSGESELERLRKDVEGHTQSLRDWADRMERDFGKDVWPGNPARLRDFAREVQERLD